MLLRLFFALICFNLGNVAFAVSSSDLIALGRDNVCVSCDFSGADLTGVDLTGADLTGADLIKADLTKADLREANLTGADLTKADLREADLTGADLTKANLTGANLYLANLDGTDLTNATLHNTICWPLFYHHSWKGHQDQVLPFELEPSASTILPKGYKCDHKKFIIIREN